MRGTQPVLCAPVTTSCPFGPPVNAVPDPLPIVAWLRRGTRETHRPQEKHCVGGDEEGWKSERPSNFWLRTGVRLVMKQFLCFITRRTATYALLVESCRGCWIGHHFGQPKRTGFNRSLLVLHSLIVEQTSMP